MSRRMLVVLFAVLLPTAFLAGWLSSRGGSHAGSGRRKVLFYVDPMNPSFRSPEPGTAPCGMPLEPVYADGPAPGGGASPPSGSVAVRVDRLQLIGVSREPISRRTLRHALRLVGSVAPDETRLFRVTAATAGRIREIGSATTGSLVGRGEILGAYYTSELLAPQQNFLRMYETYQTLQQGGINPYDQNQGGGQIASYVRNVEVARQSLLNLGMTAEQVEEIARTRQPAYLIQIRAPAAGVVTSRNVSLGQAFDALEDLFTIADLDRVWVLADAFEGQEEFFKPGTRAVVTQLGAGRRFAAVVSTVPPRFDAATRTLKVRLDVANPELHLRPDMLVDVELAVEIGPAIFVPKEAVLDSGMRRVVFVEQGEGVFVPRPVRTGRRLGEQVEVVGGLMEGEKVVTSGNFLLDSESRMRAAGATTIGAALDPICGMEVEEARARAQGLVSEHGGKAWFFCSAGCKQAFDRDPKAVAKAQGMTESAEVESPAATAPSQRAFHMEDPVCGMDVDPDEAQRFGLVSNFHGAPFSFCSPQCKQEFDRDPAAILTRKPGARTMPAAAPAGAQGHGSGHGETPSPTNPPIRQPMPDSSMPSIPGATAPGGSSERTLGMTGARETAKAKDPFCRMEVDVAKARAAGLFSEFNGVTWYFDSEECKKGFDDDPRSYLPMVR